MTQEYSDLVVYVTSAGKPRGGKGNWANDSRNHNIFFIHYTTDDLKNQYRLNVLKEMKHLFYQLLSEKVLIFRRIVATHSCVLVQSV